MGQSRRRRTPKVQRAPVRHRHTHWRRIPDDCVAVNHNSADSVWLPTVVGWASWRGVASGGMGAQYRQRSKCASVLQTIFQTRMLGGGLNVPPPSVPNLRALEREQVVRVRVIRIGLDILRPRGTGANVHISFSVAIVCVESIHSGFNPLNNLGSCPHPSGIT
jgi:hypothetical protein